MKKQALVVLFYTVFTMILGMTWHFVLFKDLYENLGIYNRAEPIIPLGFASMIIQGLILAYLFPKFYKGIRPISEALKFSFAMGLFLFSVSTLANAAKIQVTSMGQWLLVQSVFHTIQFALAGLSIGLIYRRERSS